MATIKSYTDLSQSKVLSKILSDESADMEWVYGMGEPFPVPINDEAKVNENEEPCWSLSALLSVLPKIHGVKPILDLEENSIQYTGIDLYVVADNPVDACYEMVIKLHELNLL